jgi:D-3-phosphoglycerate dehydrogenase
MAILLTLALERRAVMVHNSIANGEWTKPVGRALRGLTLGIYGFGSIGKQIHVRMISFGMKTLTFDPFLDRDEIDPQVAVVGSLSELASKSDVFIICCPLNNITRGSVNAQLLSNAKLGMVLVNVARGPIVVEGDLAHALVSGTISGAGLDVFEQEPLPLDSPLRKLDNVIFSSHNSSNTSQGVNRASLEVLRIIQSFMS